METNRSCVIKFGITLLSIGGAFWLYLHFRRSIFRKCVKPCEALPFYRVEDSCLDRLITKSQDIKTSGGICIQWTLTCYPGSVPQVGHVSKIICYPLTSCGGITEDSALCSNLGLSVLGFRDREYVVAKLFDPTSTQQYQSPLLQEVQVFVNGRNLLLKFRDQPDLLLMSGLRRESRQAFTVKCLGMETDALDCGSKVANWLSECLQEQDLRMFNCKFEWAIESKRFRSVACKLATESTLEEINDIFKFKPPQTIEQFRPNIVISGTKAMDEENWDLVYIGSQAGLEKRAFSLKLIEEAFDSRNMEWRHESEPHENMEGALCIPSSFPSTEFGIYATVFREGKITVGDPVFVVYRPTFLSSYRSW